MKDVIAYMEGAIGVVEANAFERMTLWKEYSKSKQWEEVMPSYSIRAGERDNSPVQFGLYANIVDGHKILFIEPTSNLVDYGIIYDWLKNHLPVSAFRAGGQYIRMTDALNFHSVFPLQRSRNDQ